MKNKLIILEGADGAGKSTMAKDLQNDILKKNKEIKVKVISFPHSTSFGYKKIREVLQDPDRYPPDVLQSLFVANMIECAEKVINPFFEENKENRIIILDRSLLSTIVYNALNGGTIFHSIMSHTYKIANEIVPGSISRKELDPDILSKVYGHIIQPIDFTVFLFPPIEVLIEHSKKRESKEENDGADSVIKSFEAYVSLYKFLTGSLHRDFIDFLEYSVDMLVPNTRKYDKYVGLTNWNRSKSEEQNYTAWREVVLTKLGI